MLEQQQCERILAIMQNQTIEEKVKAINEAKEMFSKAFTPGMSDSQFAYSAMVIEQQYNYIREILQVKQIRIKADLGGTIAKEKAKVAKATKSTNKPAKKPLTMDFAAMMEAFANKTAQKGASNEQGADSSNSNSSS